MTAHARFRSHAGFSLVELMVAMAISLVLTLVIARVMIDNEASRRVTTSTNDANQNAAVAAYEFDRSLRSAGSGFMQSWNPGAGNALGCEIRAQFGGTAFLPRPDDWPAPFANTPRAVRLAPLVAFRGTSATGADSDVLRVMSGNAGFAEVGRRILATNPSATSPVPANETLRMINILGWRQNDLLLLSGAATGACLLKQVGAVPANNVGDILTLAGDYSGPSANHPIWGYAGGAGVALAIGNVVNPPEFRMFGVNTATNTLVSYDLLLQRGEEAPLPVADGIVGMKVAYGVDADLDGQLATTDWLPPTGNFADTALLDGTAVSQSRLRSIIAVKVALIARSSQRERDDVSPQGTLTLFAGTPAQVQRTLITAEKQFRHRVVEATIPIRNMQLIP